MGFLAANKIGPMKTDMDVDVTFEGDNTVMMQQVRCWGESVLPAGVVCMATDTWSWRETSGMCAHMFGSCTGAV
jgi:hypothetical protein